MSNSQSNYFTVISPEGEIRACRKTGNVLSTFDADHPHHPLVGFDLKEYIDCYHEPIPDRVHFNDLAYAKWCGDTIDCYRAEPRWRINRSYLIEAAADPDVQIIEGQYGPEILCANASYSSEQDAYSCMCDRCLSDEPATKHYHLQYSTEDLPSEHLWPKWAD